MSALTLLVLSIMLIVDKKNPDYFAQAFLGGTTLKILAALAFIFIFRAKTHVDKAFFLADFMYIYLLNTVFEVYILLRNLRLKNLR